MPPIRQALAKHAKLRIDYRRGDALEASARTICPYRLIFASGTWYLVAYCEQSEGVRVFRVDRMQRAELLHDGYSMPDESTITQHLADGRVFFSDTPATLRVRYAPRIARWIQERERGTTEPDGSFVVEHQLADIDWAVRHVLQYGPEAEVLGPDSVRDAVRSRLESMLA
jgi:predicted DNA-binding transcriptional regulator YafY